LDERFTVTLAELNWRVTPETFTLAGLKLPNNIPVSEPGVTDPKKWATLQDGKVDPTRTAGQVADEAYAMIGMGIDCSPAPDHPRSPISRHWPYWLAGSLFTFVALWLIARMIRRRK
jgi:hypothetical protein